MKNKSYIRKVNQRLLFKRIKVFWQKQGFYVVLFLCVCAISTALLVTSGKVLNGNEKNANDVNRLKETDADTDANQNNQQSAVLEEEREEIPGGIYYVDYLENAQAAKELEETKDKSANDESTSTGNVSINKDEVAVAISKHGTNTTLPIIGGEIIQPFSADKLIYWETLKEFRAHTGIDLLGELGTEVVAFLPGTVKKVEADELWGVQVTLDHGHGLTSVYANLSEDTDIEVGRYVLGGEPIGYIGQSASIENNMPPHVHFELYSNNKSIDPTSYLKSEN